MSKRAARKSWIARQIYIYLHINIDIIAMPRFTCGPQLKKQHSPCRVTNFNLRRQISQKKKFLPKNVSYNNFRVSRGRPFVK